MNVVFVLTETAEDVLQMVSTDVAGLLAAVKGDNVSFPFGTYQYDSHTLDHYLLENGSYQQELVIYLKPEQNKTETVLPVQQKNEFGF